MIGLSRPAPSRPSRPYEVQIGSADGGSGDADDGGRDQDSLSMPTFAVEWRPGWNMKNREGDSAVPEPGSPSFAEWPPCFRSGGSAEAAASSTSTTGLTALTPVRLLDTRTGLAAMGPVPAGATVKLPATDAPDEPPPTVGAVVLNVTVTQPTRAGWVSVFPDGTSRPATSNVNFPAGATVANLVVAPVGSDGSVDLYNGSGGTIQVIADIPAWFFSVLDCRQQRSSPCTRMDQPSGSLRGHKLVTHALGSIGTETPEMGQPVAGN
jgi:hypothetical protein